MRKRSLAYKEGNDKKVRVKINKTHEEKIDLNAYQCGTPSEMHKIKELYLAPVFKLYWSSTNLDYLFIEDLCKPIGHLVGGFGLEEPTIHIAGCDIKTLDINGLCLTNHLLPNRTDICLNLTGNPNMEVVNFPKRVQTLSVDAPVYYNYLRHKISFVERLFINYDF